MAAAFTNPRLVILLIRLLLLLHSNLLVFPSFKRSLAKSYAFFFTTSSMLVPKSLSMTVAAFRPGPPVTDPPGWVVAPV
jgi:hypothetical protein